MKSKKNKIIIALSIMLLSISNLSAVNIKMENGVQYNNSKIILEEKVFPESRDKVEVAVTLGTSTGRMLINRNDIFLIELPESQLKPRIINKTGNVKITDFAGKNVEYGFISPLDNIEIGEKSQMEISFNSIPALRIGANTKFKAALKDIDPSLIAIEESNGSAGAAEINSTVEEIIFELQKGELFGIFDEKNNPFTNGFIIDCADAMIIVKSPRFYIKYSVANGETQLTIFPLTGHIIFTAKKMDKKFLLRGGKYVDMYNGDRIQKPLDYKQSPEMSRIFQMLDKQ